MNKLIFQLRTSTVEFETLIGPLPGFMLYYFVRSQFVHSTWIASDNAYLFENAFFFFYIKHINLKLELLKWAPGVQDVGVTQRYESFITV